MMLRSDASCHHGRWSSGHKGQPDAGSLAALPRRNRGNRFQAAGQLGDRSARPPGYPCAWWRVSDGNGKAADGRNPNGLSLVALHDGLASNGATGDRPPGCRHSRPTRRNTTNQLRIRPTRRNATNQLRIRPTQGNWNPMGATAGHRSTGTHASHAAGPPLSCVRIPADGRLGNPTQGNPVLDLRQHTPEKYGVTTSEAKATQRNGFNLTEEIDSPFG